MIRLELSFSILTIRVTDNELLAPESIDADSLGLIEITAHRVITKDLSKPSSRTTGDHSKISGQPIHELSERAGSHQTWYVASARDTRRRSFYI